MTDNEYEALDSGQMSIDSSTMDAQTSQWSTSWTQGLTAGSNGTTSIDLSSLSALSKTQAVIGGGIAGAVGSPYTITTDNTGGYNWNISSSPTTISQAGRIALQGSNADIEINGMSMRDWMAKVEERLNILTPNPELEKEWDELRRLGERYRKLEKKCKEKAEMWKQLKKMPAPRPDQF